jgi:Domain of unknown function (DUF4588)
MDSMRSLNTSLPAAYSSRQPPPEQLLQAFKTAALSVTNLYKSAVTDQSNSRAAGYQDALDDLMKFLDQENLGLQDGEGWRVRQWVSERYDGTANQPQAEAEEEKHETEQRARSAPPSGNPPPEPQQMLQDQDTTENKTDIQISSSEPTEVSQAEPIFRFTAGMDQTRVDGSRTCINDDSTPPIRVEVINRGSRTPHRGSQRHNTRSSNRDFTLTAGTKRKLQFPDFFDITNIGPGDGSGGGSKRSRFA